VPIVRGRNFTAQETAASRQVVIVNQTFAKQVFPGQDPIGKHFGLGNPQYSSAFEIGQLLIRLAIGLPAALLAGQLIACLLYRVGAYDPTAFLAATGVLTVCATVAVLIPAQRAASIDPMQALRAD
jgi:hypothetical protein